MRLIVGLGNPGARYENTRHNVGFMVLDRWLSGHPTAQWREQYGGLTADLSVDGTRLLLLKPLTFMNRSGQSVRKAAQFFKIPPSDVVIVHDEVDLAFGEVRLKRGGGEAGHNGLKSVTSDLGTQDYVRLRCGVGRPPPEFRGDTADFVLQAPSPADQPQLEALISKAVEALEMVIRVGLDQAMNSTNRRSKT
jgi:PTH1 family peptidyl-tRNA hydrolase